MNQTPANFAAAIFDFDGTLVDTMPMHFEAYRHVLAEVGIDLTSDEFYRNVGGNARETIPKLLRGRACRLSTDEIHARKKTRVVEVFTQQPIMVLETSKLLPLLHGRLPLALVSSGARVGIDVVLRRLDWQRYFEVVITGEDAAHGKPAPDLFLLAAQRLRVAPQACMAFEDTDAGVESAAAAGMQVFDVRRVCSPTSVEGR